MRMSPNIAVARCLGIMRFRRFGSDRPARCCFGVGFSAWWPLLYRFWPRKQIDHSQDIAFAVLLTYLVFLVVIMIFGADPMEPSLSIAREGAGMSPSLQHPAMLIHPPVVFLGYAIWAVPFALALSALLTGQINRHWFEQARRWTLCAWTVLGIGHTARREMGLRRTWLGRLLGLGSRGKRLADALAYRHRDDSLRPCLASIEDC